MNTEYWACSPRGNTQVLVMRLIYCLRKFLRQLAFAIRVSLLATSLSLSSLRACSSGRAAK